MRMQKEMRMDREDRQVSVDLTNDRREEETDAGSNHFSVLVIKYRERPEGRQCNA